MKNYEIKKQHDKGKYHAIERISLLLDKGTFHEIGSGIVNYGYHADSEDKPIAYDGVITGYGMIKGKTVYLFAQDFSIRGGSLGLRHGKKIAHIIELAIKAKCPVIGVYDSGGARIEEGVNALAGCGEMMYYNTLASGYIPQIAIIVGPCAGAAAYSPAIMDFVFSVEKISCLFITGADVVKSVTSEECTMQELGGAKIHSTKSGVSHFYSKSEKECYSSVRNLVEILPSSYTENVNYNKVSYIDKPDAFLNPILPDSARKAYNIKDVINELVDQESFIEVHERFAANMVVGFAKLSGITIGIVSNQPQMNGGSIDCDSSDKAARFVQFCDSFHIPIITLVDTPGYLPGKDQEHNGIIRHGAKLLFAYSESTVTKITVVLRKAYGGAYIAMGSKHLGADFTYALPDAEIAVMGAESAASIIYKKMISSVEDSQKTELLNQKTEEYADKYMNATTAIREGYVDEIIPLKNMREKIFHDIIALACKVDYAKPKKKHGNIPL